MSNVRPESSLSPSTDWKEVLLPNEEAMLAEYAQRFRAAQERKSAIHGNGRMLHRKQLLAARGSLTVLDGLPEFARQGLFAQTATFPVLIRLSNGGMDKANDRTPDIRGFSLAVQDVKGESALGGEARAQCFALINHSKFSFQNSVDFMDFVLAAEVGKGALLKFLIRRFGLFGGPRRLAQMVSTMGRPFNGFASETFFSAAPIACGRYAVRVCLRAEQSDVPQSPIEDFHVDMAQRLQKAPLTYSLELQPYVNEDVTPIEDATVDWPTPYTRVARLTLPIQDLTDTNSAVEQEVERGIFDPWMALADHRPLGNVMRARKVIYFSSQQGRGAAK